MLWTDFNRLWDPWDEFERMRRALWGSDAGRSSEFPSVNTWASSDEAVVTTEIPGVDPDNIDISVTGKTLTLRGSRKIAELKDDQSYHRRERWSGGFSKAIELPFNVAADKVTAKFKKGILYVTLPKAEAEKPKKIEIKSN